ncbi:conjugative transposon protein TraN [Flavobacterium sp.]|uniref:conjugative transposon protein TraN n=1 Tax=Flavobacterium sp. TaxID=239 RepID=UPI004033E113
MKSLFKKVVAMLAIAMSGLTATTGVAQSSNLLDAGKVEPYEMEVTFDKTSHIIFPSAIRYIDLGSDYLVAGKAEDADNVLRVKAAVRDFEEETNFSVITEDGRFYSFNAYYSAYPYVLSYDMLKLGRTLQRNSSNDVLFEELGNNSPSVAGLLLETIYQKDKRLIRHIGSKSYSIQFLLKGIYTHRGSFYFHTELRNTTNVPFRIDFVNFKVVDKKVAKRTVAQERALTALRMYKPLMPIAAQSKEQNVFLLDQFTIDDEKVLLVEIYEKSGGRHQLLEVSNSDLVGAKRIEDMHLKIKSR